MYKRQGSYGLDPLHYLTLPSFSWDACLRKTRVELDLLNDPEKFLMIENNIRGGLSGVSHRHVSANNPYTEHPYNSSLPNSYISYVNANNLYGHAMRQPLPTGKFRFLQPNEIRDLEKKIRTVSIETESETGYILDFDLDYPSHLHDDHNTYPCAPEQVTITRDMLSPYSMELAEGHPTSCEKLVPNLNDKRNYVLHYRNLQLYMRLGLVLVRIHRVLEFKQKYSSIVGFNVPKQKAWLREYIDFNTTPRSVNMRLMISTKISTS